MSKNCLPPTPTTNKAWSQVCNQGHVHSGTEMPVPFQFGGIGGLKAWYAADLSGSSIGKVATWYDLSGNAVNLGQPTATKQPVLTEAAIDNKPAMLFDGVDDIFHASSLPVAASISQPLSITAVIRRTSAANPASNMSPWGFAHSSVNTQFILNRITTSGVHTGAWVNDAAAASNTGTASAADTNPHVVTFTWDATTMKVFLDGAANGAGATPTGATTVQQFAVGGMWRSADTQFFQGYIAEVIIYAADLATDRSAVETYCGRKYGIRLT